MRLTTRSICVLTVAVALLAACAVPAVSQTDSFYRCDRNGEREQRVACEP